MLINHQQIAVMGVLAFPKHKLSGKYSSTINWPPFFCYINVIALTKMSKFVLPVSRESEYYSCVGT